MEKYELYKDIAQRTNGDIYIGVVGPVRTGKSTFIKRFMDVMVIPNIKDENQRMRLIDELPQSAAGRTIMTTQPRFIPNEAATLDIEQDCTVRVRLADCVGYMVEGAVGHTENNVPRMIRTPWFDYDIPFEEAAEIGTNKIITEHSTIGILITTDGSITDIDRSAYIQAEGRVITELKAAGRPFVVLVNSTSPAAPTATELAKDIAEKYGVISMTADVMHMEQAQFERLLSSILMAFPMRCVQIKLPTWVNALGSDHWLVQRITSPFEEALQNVEIMGDGQSIVEALQDLEDFDCPISEGLDLAQGLMKISMAPAGDMFYKIISEECGYEILDDAHLISSIKEFIVAKREYDRIRCALEQASATGYGTVPPDIDDMVLDEPEIVQRGGRFGVKLRAHASGLHLIKVNIESEVSPLVGTEEQSEEFASYLSGIFEKDPARLWQTDIFGKSLYDMVKEGMSSKVSRMPENVQQKLQNTVERMVNEGCNGLICIML